MTLTSDEVSRVRSLHVRLDMVEVEEIYLPLSRLLSLYVAATQRLFGAQQNFLCTRDVEMPYIIGVAGSVAVGKSTMARLLRELLVRWPNVPKVDRVTTDGFLYPNSVLEREGLMERKGFPESYDLSALLHFLSDIKAGRRPVRAPVYSHLLYDVIPSQWVEIDRPDILIVEGLNMLQTGSSPRGDKAIPYVSDFLDFSIYLDAAEDVLLTWYVNRFLTLRGTSFRDPKSYFHRNAALSDQDAVETATSIWKRINLCLGSFTKPDGVGNTARYAKALSMESLATYLRDGHHLLQLSLPCGPDLSDRAGPRAQTVATIRIQKQHNPRGCAAPTEIEQVLGLAVNSPKRLMTPSRATLLHLDTPIVCDPEATPYKFLAPRRTKAVAATKRNPKPNTQLSLGRVASLVT